MWWKMIERNSHNEELIMSEGGGGEEGVGGKGR